MSMDDVWQRQGEAFKEVLGALKNLRQIGRNVDYFGATELGDAERYADEVIQKYDK